MLHSEDWDFVIDAVPNGVAVIDLVSSAKLLL